MDDTAGPAGPMEGGGRRRRALGNQRAVVAHAYEKSAAAPQPLAHCCESRLDVCVALKVRYRVVHRYDNIVGMDWRRREAPHIINPELKAHSKRSRFASRPLDRRGRQI